MVIKILLHRVNAVSNAQVRGDMYDSGCLGQTGFSSFLSRCICSYIAHGAFTI